MSKYANGTYRVTYFDLYGAKIFTEPAKNIAEAVERGKVIVDSADHLGSFVVQRVVYNSMDLARYESPRTLEDLEKLANLARTLA